VDVTILFILTSITGFYMAWNIGANDVANSMGTSVGSGVLSIRNAVIVASLLNISGAVLVGSHVTDTIRKGIVSPEAFSSNPEVFAYGAFAALLGAGLWITIATHLQLPISTTHSIVGAIVGFGLIYAGFSVINLQKLFFIILSWIISPIAGAILSFIIFKEIDKYVLDTDTPFESAERVFHYIVFIVFFVLSISIFYKGLRLKLGILDVICISLVIGLIAGIIGNILIKRYKLRVTDQYAAVEKVFGKLQIISACCVAFAHGSNDVANAIGPVAAILSIIETHTFKPVVHVPFELLLLGGIGIAIGILTWGYKVMETIGKKITEITPTRGFAAEFGAATTVLACSKMGLPISTSHTLVGSVIGVGFARGITALNLNVVKNIVVSWIVTIPFAALFTMVIYEILIHIL